MQTRLNEDNKVKYHHKRLGQYAVSLQWRAATHHSVAACCSRYITEGLHNWQTKKQC